MQARSYLKIFWSVAICSTVLSGCLFGSGGGKRDYYVINELPTSDFHADHRRPVSLLVKNAGSGRFIDGFRILYSADPARREYYQFATWVETPPKYFIDLLVRKLEKAEVFSAVVREGVGASSDFTLATEVVNFYHDISNPPGRVIVRVRAELIDSKRRNVVASKYFDREAPVTEYSASGAVKGFELAVNQVVDEMIQWLDSECTSGVG